MSIWSGIGGAISAAIASVNSMILSNYAKYGSIYSVLQIDSKISNMNLGVGNNLKNSLNEIPETNTDHLKQFLEEPLTAVFDYFEAKKEIENQEPTLIEMRKILLNSDSEHVESMLKILEKQKNELKLRIENNKYSEHLE